jgi:hypothetical protein
MICKTKNAKNIADCIKCLLPYGRMDNMEKRKYVAMGNDIDQGKVTIIQFCSLSFCFYTVVSLLLGKDGFPNKRRKIPGSQG